MFKTKNVAEILIRYLWIARSFTLEEREQQYNDYIRRTVGLDKIVLMLVSGGVDSTVCAALLHKPLLQGNESSRVQAIHIDSGFLRKDESEQVVTSLQKLRLNLQEFTDVLCLQLLKCPPSTLPVESGNFPITKSIIVETFGQGLNPSPLDPYSNILPQSYDL
ncbi:putative GMP synthase [Daphnia magna]|uniref:Putative GMP synthase n=1 Tax=Daphnia magna TaxID=35525 RepID=A0A162PKA0_9CRUS|nr:putative GMP synthase [Daphnia magna]